MFFNPGEKDETRRITRCVLSYSDRSKRIAENFQCMAYHKAKRSFEMRNMMKHVLITGEHSYIGNSFQDYAETHFKNEFVFDRISVRSEKWKEIDFGEYDCIYDVAGIAHADTGHVSEETKAKYYAVNRDLTIALAEKAKKDGAKQFVFMSSAIVYGNSAPIGVPMIITEETIPEPADFYGDSKLQAEKGILPLSDSNFKVAVLRPPMIYGKGSKGNYPVLSKMAQKLPAFPKVHNCRSMLYIGNLAEFVRLIIQNEESGIFFPQNREYSNTSEMVQMIAAAHGKKMKLVRGTTWGLKLMSHTTGLVDKAFGNLAYDMPLSEYREDYQKYTLEESVKLTEGK